MLDQEQAVRFLARERRMIQAYIRAMVPDFHLAEDILQEVFVVVLNRRDQFAPGTNFCAWVREIARRVALAHLRKTGRHALVLDPETLDVMEDVLDVDPVRWEEERTALRVCVERLPAESQKILTLRYVDERPLTGIAEAVGRSIDGVKGLLKRIRQKLGECVGERLRRTRLSGGTAS